MEAVELDADLVLTENLPGHALRATVLPCCIRMVHRALVFSMLCLLTSLCVKYLACPIDRGALRKEAFVNGSLE